MKLNNFKKININKEFDPVTHWYLLLSIVSLFLIFIIAYASYVFLNTKGEISSMEITAQNNIQNSTSTEYIEKTRNENKFLKDINNLNKILDEYNKKEIEYNKLINNSVKFAANVSTSTASSTVATSTQ